MTFNDDPDWLFNWICESYHYAYLNMLRMRGKVEKDLWFWTFEDRIKFSEPAEECIYSFKRRRF